MKEKLPSYGGQALIEGVVMRGTYTVSAAMRDPDKNIIIQTEELQNAKLNRFWKMPFLRGLLILWDSLRLGYRYLAISANLQLKEYDEKENKGGFLPAIIISVVFSILLFMVLPAIAAGLLERYLGLHSFVTNLMEGLFRLLILILYLLGIGQMEDVKRVFGYHGAEHKTINAYESGFQMTAESVMKCSVQHPRCGTSFLLTLVVITIILFTLFGPLSLQARILSRIILIPVLASISYEYIRWASKHIDNYLIRILFRPNLALQGLTTREPDIDMVETALMAFNTMMEGEKKHDFPQSPLV